MLYMNIWSYSLIELLSRIYDVIVINAGQAGLSIRYNSPFSFLILYQQITNQINEVYIHEPT